MRAKLPWLPCLPVAQTVRSTESCSELQLCKERERGTGRQQRKIINRTTNSITFNSKMPNRGLSLWVCCCIDVVHRCCTSKTYIHRQVQIKKNISRKTKGENIRRALTATEPAEPAERSSEEVGEWECFRQVRLNVFSQIFGGHNYRYLE